MTPRGGRMKLAGAGAVGAAIAVAAAILAWGAMPAFAQTRPAKSRATESPGAMIDRANHFVMLGRCADAIPILERLTADNPRISAANEMLAGCYLREGRSSSGAFVRSRASSSTLAISGARTSISAGARMPSPRGAACSPAT
jgi:predicted Zn-dependent protease